MQTASMATLIKKGISNMDAPRKIFKLLEQTEKDLIPYLVEDILQDYPGNNINFTWEEQIEWIRNNDKENLDLADWLELALILLEDDNENVDD